MRRSRSFAFCRSGLPCCPLPTFWRSSDVPPSYRSSSTCAPPPIVSKSTIMRKNAEEQDGQELTVMRKSTSLSSSWWRCFRGSSVSDKEGAIRCCFSSPRIPGCSFISLQDMVAVLQADADAASAGAGERVLRGRGERMEVRCSVRTMRRPVTDSKCKKKPPRKIHEAEMERHKHDMLEADRQNNGKACILTDTTRILQDLLRVSLKG